MSHMHSLFAVCVALSFAQITVGAHLEFVSVLPQDCRDLQFAAPEFGWCGGRERILQTDDGGLTWSPLLTPPFANARRSTTLSILDESIEQFQLLSRTRAWVRSRKNLLWTHDGGRTWQKRNLPLSGEGFVKDVHFADVQRGWLLGQREVPGDPLREWIRYRVAGERSVYVPAVFRTDDGGSTWTTVRYPDLGLIASRLEFTEDGRNGLAIELNRTLFTRDGGSTWGESDYCTQVDKALLHYAEPGTGTFSGTSAHLLDDSYGWWTVEGDIFRTTDGGRTWCLLPPIREGSLVVRLAAIRFSSRSLGWALPNPYQEWEVRRHLYESTDGGRSWVKVAKPPDARLEGLVVVAADTVFCWGDRKLYRLVRS
jgi:photosystem II stability/assembly factor-like uncharacterized protein